MKTYIMQQKHIPQLVVGEYPCVSGMHSIPWIQNADNFDMGEEALINWAISETKYNLKVIPTTFKENKTMNDHFEFVASVCHAVNKAYCEAIGDFTQPLWKDAPQWQKDSAILGAQKHFESNFTMKPEDSHNSWWAQKVADGWVFGSVKDPVAKTHPCCVSYNELPLEQRIKDHLFGAVVKALNHG